MPHANPLDDHKRLRPTILLLHILAPRDDMMVYGIVGPYDDAARWQRLLERFAS